LLAEMRGLMTHCERNRASITLKINNAKMLAETALKPTPAKRAA
jgi:hypothetical protein